MFVGLLGPSCAGKSFFLTQLNKTGFHVPISITTRPGRDDETWHINAVHQQEFDRLRNDGRLCFVTGAFNHAYACLDFLPEHQRGDAAIIITEENVPELMQCGGIVIQLLPTDPAEAIKRIRLLDRGDPERRIQQLTSAVANAHHQVGMDPIN